MDGMGETEAILMAAADAVRAWRQMPGVSRSHVIAADPELADALERLDETWGDRPADRLHEDGCPR